MRLNGIGFNVNKHLTATTHHLKIIFTSYKLFLFFATAFSFKTQRKK